MKKSLLTLTAIGVSALTMYGQGRVNFNNYLATGPQYVTVGAQNQGASGGNSGNYPGASYSIRLLWVPGTVTTQAAFDAANPTGSATFAFFDVTGPSNAQGAGLFDAGTVAIGAAGTYTMQAQAWFNNGQFATYSAAVTGGRNTGLSSLIQVGVTASPTPAPNTAFTPFTVGTTGTVPEPSTFALAGLGAAALLLFRRRK